MSTPLNYTMTTESIVVVVDGGKTYSVKRGAPNYAALREALVARDWDKARANLTIAQAVSAWASGKFSSDGRVLYFGENEIKGSFARKVLGMITRSQSPEPLLRFYERLAKNPSYRSVTQLFDFMEHTGISISGGGLILAYKGVNHDFRDCHSNSFDNSPGNRHEMPRNQISDDPEIPCHEGFHVGAIEYARNFGPRVVVCAVDPRDVVCVPKDSACQKMRVCAYRVVGHYGEPLPDVVNEPIQDVDPTTPEPIVIELGPLPTAAELINLPMNELRDCARRMKIVGYSTLDGGKSALVKAILSALRGHRE